MRKVSRWQLSGVPMLGLASILEQTVKSLHEANEHPSTDASEQYTILDGLKLLSDDKFRSRVLAKVSDPYLLEWWGRDFRSWPRQYKADALAPVQTRLSNYASSRKARSILGQSRSTIDMRRVIQDGGVLLVSTSQGTAGRDVSALVEASILNLVDGVIREQGSVPLKEQRGVLVVWTTRPCSPIMPSYSVKRAILCTLRLYGTGFRMDGVPWPLKFGDSGRAFDRLHTGTFRRCRSGPDGNTYGGITSHSRKVSNCP